jgi:hypothetical protein
MTRPVGVTASAVVAIIGSVVTLLFAGLMVASAYIPEAQIPSSYRGIVMWAAAAFVTLAALGGWTAVGLFRMRDWARTSILVFAGIMATLSLLSLVLVMVIPLPPTPGATPNAPSASTMRSVMAAFYGGPLVIGVWWLVLFNKKSIKQAFTAAGAPGEASRRPLSVSIIGWWNVVGGAICLIPATMSMPAFIAGVILTGWSATLAYVFFAAVGLYLGWGLLKLDERARVLMIAWLALSAVHVAYVALVPGPRDRMREFERSLRIEGMPPQQPAFDATTFATSMMLFAVVFFALAIWFLVRNKAAFRHDGEPAVSTPSA